MTNTHTTPLARTDQLLVEQIGEESVVYDLETSVAHALSPIAAATFMYADGTRTVDEIAELATLRLDHTVSADEVQTAVDQLSSLSLLDAVEAGHRLSRRDALKTFAVAGAGVLMVSSVAAPAALACSVSKDTALTCANSSTPDGPYYPTTATKTGGATISNWGLAVPATSGSTAAFYPIPDSAEFNGYTPEVTYGSSAGCYYMTGGTTYSTSGTWVAGKWQCVPCDQNYNGTHYACCQVVCAPAGAGVNWGTGTAYIDLWGKYNYYGKYCQTTTGTC